MSDSDEIDRCVRALDRGYLSSVEFLGQIGKYASQSAAHRDEALNRLDALLNHPQERVRDAVQQIRDMLFQEKTLIRDITQIRRTSPLQPGCRVQLSGGYTAAYRQPEWRIGRGALSATFLDFVDRGGGKMPAALLKLDEPLVLPGLQGQYALLTLRYVGDWAETETVAIYLTDIAPADIASFASALPESSEIESHASYSICRDEKPPTG